MSTTMSPVVSDPGPVDPEHALGGGGSPSLIDRIYGLFRSIPTGALWLIVIIWSLPTLGLFVSGFRTADDQRATGWWNLFGSSKFPYFVDPDQLTFSNYDQVINTETYNLWKSLLNSMAIAVPATIIPIAIAAFAAYAFAWIDFRGRKQLFIATVALLAIPLQVALIPLLQLWNNGAHYTIPGLDKTITLIPDFDLVNTTTAVWLTHTGFALPFAIFLLHNYISSLPKDLFEAARIDGADHFTVFYKLVLPLSVPVLAAFAIFQFLWTWNDYLVANTMAGTNPDAIPTTIVIANLAGDFGANENLLPAAGFIQAFLPILVFFALQRYFVRGLLAGSVKG
jgi:alpha-glucoside transport system permease protein